MLFRKKKGSVILMLSLLFLALIILVFSIIRASIGKGIYSGVESLGRIWGISIISEYDRYLYRDYGILAFDGDEKNVNSKLNKYALTTFSGKKYIKYQGAKSSLAGYELKDPNNFQEQIKNAVTLKYAPKDLVHEERSILNDRIFKGLPSNQSDTTTLKKDMRASTILYGISHFNSNIKVVNPKSYFKNEIEYLICGKDSDEKNRKAIKSYFIKTRLVANSAYIYSHAEMMEATLAAATALTPGPEAAITQVALIETWALLESKNDWEILIHQGRVPLAKTKETWALDESVLLDDKTKGYVDTKSKTGLDYDGYLKTLLMTKKESTLIYRMMDLIQINMKYNHYKDFLISDYNTGLDYSINVNGEGHDFYQSY